MSEKGSHYVSDARNRRQGAPINLSKAPRGTYGSSGTGVRNRLEVAESYYKENAEHKFTITMDIFTLRVTTNAIAETHF